MGRNSHSHFGIWLAIGVLLLVPAALLVVLHKKCTDTTESEEDIFV